MSCLSNTEVCTPLIKLFWLTEAKSGIFDQKSGTRPEKAGRMVTLPNDNIKNYELRNLKTGCTRLAENRTSILIKRND